MTITPALPLHPNLDLLLLPSVSPSVSFCLALDAEVRRHQLSVFEGFVP